MVGTAVLLRSCTAQAQMSPSGCLGTSRDSEIAIVSISVIDAPYIIPFVQIPIAHRRG
jgi:hypothetical protein